MYLEDRTVRLQLWDTGKLTHTCIYMICRADQYSWVSSWKHASVNAKLTDVSSQVSLSTLCLRMSS
jgi:hypothetical protein